MALNKKTRQEVLKKYHNRCAYCGVQVDIKSMQVDHIRSKHSFKSGFISVNNSVDDICNLNPACRRCNNFKAGMNLKRFRSELQEQINRARLRSVNFRMAEKFGQIKITEHPIQFYFEMCRGHNYVKQKSFRIVPLPKV